MDAHCEASGYHVRVAQIFAILLLATNGGMLIAPEFEAAAQMFEWDRSLR